MLNQLRQRLSPTTRFLFGLAGILGLLLVVAGLWWFLPFWPRLILDSPARCYQVAASADGRVLATGHSDQLILWDLATGLQRKTLPLDWAVYNHEPLLLASDGQTVAFGEMHGHRMLEEVKFWSPALENPVVLPGAWSIQMLSGRNLVTYSERSIIIWDMTTGKERKSIPLGYSVLAANEELLVVNKEPTISIYDSQTLDERSCLLVQHTPAPPDPLNPEPQVVLGKKCKLLAASDPNGILTVWDLATGRKRGSLEPPIESYPRVLSADGKRLLTYSADERMVMWDISSVPFRQLGATEKSTETCLWDHSRDGQWFCIGSIMTGPVLLYSASTFEPTNPLAGADENSWPQFAPDGKTVAGTPELRSNVIGRWLGIRSQSRCVTLWEVPSGRVVASFRACSKFAYLLDGRVLATWDPDGPIQIWDLPLQRPLLVECGLPVFFVLLVLLAIWHCLRFRKVGPAGTAGPTTSSPEIAPC